MTARWLAGTIYDQELGLTKDQRQAIEQSANVRLGKRPHFLLVVVVQMAFIIVLMVMVADPLTDLMQTYVRTRWLAAVLILLPINIVYGCLCVWMLMRLYVPPMRLAMREHGLDVCLRCGYWLRGLDDTTRQCPECGSPREPVQPQ